jgi:serine/threonine protein kinase
MNKYLIPILVFLSIPIFTTSAINLEDHRRKMEELDREIEKINAMGPRKFEWNENDNNQAIIDQFGNRDIANKAKAGLGGNFGGMKTFQIPDKDPHYDYIQTDQKLGAGTFKEVWLAYRKDVNGNKSESVALSIFKSNPGDQRGVFNYYKIFKESDGLMEVYDVFPEKWAYVTKFYNGDLDKLAKKSPSLTDLNYCTYNVIKGLKKLRKEHLYHGDLKPANMLFRVNSKGGIQCVLADFDTLILLSPQTQTFKGGTYTPMFMYPGLLHNIFLGQRITEEDHLAHDQFSVAISMAKILFSLPIGTNFKESKAALDKILNLNHQYSSRRSESDYLEWNKTMDLFQNAFRKESQQIKQEGSYLKMLIEHSIQ